MDFNEFFQRTKAIAGGRYFAVKIEASKHDAAVAWAAYVDGPGWTSSAHKTFPCDERDPELVLRTLAAMRCAWIEPQPDPPPPDPAGLEDVGAPAASEAKAVQPEAEVLF
jgi:hypothetical protein